MSPWKQAVAGLAKERRGGGDTKSQVGTGGMIEKPLPGESLHMANSFVGFLFFFKGTGQIYTVLPRKAVFQCWLG